MKMISNRIYILFICSLLLVTKAFGNVTVTPGGNLNLCVGTSYTTIGKITIAEGAANDFSANASIQSYEINAPSNFEFNPGNGSVTATGADITFSALTVTATKITLYYLLNATATTDKFELTNIQIRATNSSGSQNIVRTGGDAVQAGNAAYSNVHASVSANQAFVNLNLGSQNEVCINEGNITLSGGNPGGGNFSGTGVSGGTTFNPTTAGVGIFVITYSATQNGCLGTATANIKVNPKPVVTFFGLASSYCSNAEDAPLIGFPSGGTFSGSIGISGNVFKPSVPSVGNKNIKYKYTDANGCSDSLTLPTAVIQAPSVSITVTPVKGSYAINDVPVVISGTQSNPSSGGTIILDGDGVSNSTSTFTPSAAGPGTHTIYRTLKAPNGCLATDKREMTVSNSNNVFINGLDTKYCIYSSPANLSTNFGSGVFSGNGIVSSSVNSTTGTAVFDPSKVDFLGQQQVTVEITLTIGIAQYYLSTVVSKRPIVKIIQDITAPNFRTVFCNQDAPVPISVSTFPAGGTGFFSGSQAIVGNNFDPSATTLFGSSQKILYEYTDISGCTNKDSVTVIVNEVTTGLDFTGLNPNYCDKNAVDTLKQTNFGSKFSGGFFTGFGINGNTFNPAIAAQYNNGALSKDYTITYTYVNSAQCMTVIQKTTKVNITPFVTLGGLNPSKEYCYGDPSTQLTGSPSSSASGLGQFSIKALTSTVVDPNTLSVPTAIFSPNKTTNPGTYRIYYKYSETTSTCTNTDSATVVIYALPVVTFTNLESAYCEYEKDVQLNGSPSSALGSSYTSIGNTASIVNGKFQVSATQIGKHTIIYTFKDDHGCSSSDSLSTIIYGKPDTTNGVKTPVKLSTICENDIITISDNNSKIVSQNGSTSSIVTANWLIDTTTFVKNYLDNPKIKLSAGNHKITYKLITDKGCSNTFDTIVTIGSYPKTSFTWDEICNNTETKFQNTTPNLAVGKVETVVWNFSDPDDPFDSSKDSIRISNSINGDHTHTYNLPKTYKVFLKAYSDYKCIATDTHNVFILESRTIKKNEPYSNDFNDLVSDWVESTAVDSISSSWVLGVPSKKHIKSADGAWVTSLTKTFTPDEHSYVYSPCFTIDASITKPMIHLDIWSWTNLNSSGANLQYSRNGRDWNTLGKRNESGVNWYNNTGNIASRPAGAQLDQDGWTDTIKGWKNARHVFDNELGSSKNIRFRISFAGNKDTTEGFAFDNVWIGDRTRLILAEHFTNNASLFTRSENERINNLINENSQNGEPKDIIQLQYHTAFPGFDPMNQRNIPDPGARALYYGVTQVPYSSVDGSYFNGSAFRIDTNMIDTRALYDPAFEFELKPVVTETTVTGSIDITNKLPVKNNVTVYISLLERYVNKIPGNSGESTYEWVHAKFLPNAAGTSFLADWSSQKTKTINLGWTIPEDYFYDSKKLAMVAFVQDNVTKEIYQAAYKGIGATVTTAVFEPNETSSTVSLYPNPANDATTVVLNGKLKGNYTWVIFDELGRITDQGSLQDGTEGFTINTQSYASGFYTLRLSNSSDGVKTQKFVVVH